MAHVESEAKCHWINHIYWGNIGVMERKMETTVVHWGYIGRMEKKMETTKVYWSNRGIVDSFSRPRPVKRASQH